MIKTKKNQKLLNGKPYLTAKIISAKRPTFWYANEIGETYYLWPTRYQHRPQQDGKPGEWYYEVVDHTGKLINECDIIILDNYEIPDELFEV